ncbi:type VII secretion-associated serine protease mycosin [Mycobacteroides sp. LB1]|uniref:type VII secretion-associated serine protease mycosin n=1 Tax=Mycobacteroides sp. LB1 TaxID=2750814 RepID=UPI0015DD644B|nr:type VII secretion-associated serine protease mycosin [Mycobacteroides sp. LB1]
MVNPALRGAAVLATVGLVALLAPPPAQAIGPPIVEPGPPPAGSVGPTEPTEQKQVCAVTGLLPGTDARLQTAADMMLNYEGARQFSRGFGQKVAVIDTGVSPHPRLRVEPGGDYVSNSDGLQDCDAHGTLVAGIIAAAPSDTDNFAGVAPEATILSIRQNSSSFAIKGSGSNKDDPNSNSAGYGNTTTLAFAITRAVELGATVINLSEVACAPEGVHIDDNAVGRAVRYAYERNVVVVAAAGNVGKDGACKTQNDMTDPNRSMETAWPTVKTVASPAYFSQYVLTVAALDKEAEPAEFSLRGPWIGVAAPGEGILSLDPFGPGVINGIMGQQGLAPINGTSFAAPFVSGLVALVRSQRPDLNAGQVIELIKRTARTPGNGPNIASGYGMIDPVAALSAEVPPADQMPDPDMNKAVVELPKTGHAATLARNVMLIATATCIAAMVAVWALFLPSRRREEATAPVNDIDAVTSVDIKR